MRTTTLLGSLVAVCALCLAGQQTSAAEALPDFFFPFPPHADAVETTPVPLRPQASPAAPRRLGPPQKPPVALADGDRVLLLGDQLLRGELEHGYLETRLTVQHPHANIVFHNLSWLSLGPLTEPGPSDATKPPDSWLTPLLHRVARFQPTVVFLGFGTEAAAAGQAGLEPFRASLDRLIDGLLASPVDAPPRLVVLSPLSRALASPSASDTETPANDDLPYAQVLWEVADRQRCEFIDLYRWSQTEVERVASPAGPDTEPAPALATQGMLLTPYGYWRLTTALERGLRWNPNNWRFGYLTDETLRIGQFGIELTQRARSARHMTATTIEDRLPTPNPPGFSEADPAPRARCYIQVTGLDPGFYVLQVDGAPVVQGTEADWAHYRIISRGPSWDQAERLRQTIVRKNALVLERWRASDPEAAETLTDPQVAELQAEIARLRQPVPRQYELRRVDPPRAPPRLRSAP